MTTYHTYADVQAFRDYLAGTTQSASWTADSAAIVRILEAVSRTIDNALGGRSFGPVIATRSYDLGEGTLRTNALFDPVPALSLPDYWPGNLAGDGVVPLDDWLLTASTVTAYTGTARASSQTLTEGISADFLLEPYNSSPKHTLKLQEETTKTLYDGQMTLTIAGTWGYQQTTRAMTTLSAAIVSTSATTCTVTSASGISAGQTLVIDSEQVYVSGVSGATLTIRRGVNGTTAATHLNGAAVSLHEYPADIVQMALELARNRWRERDAGNGPMIGSGETGLQVTRPGAEERALLRRLDYYRGTREVGVFF